MSELSVGKGKNVKNVLNTTLAWVEIPYSTKHLNQHVPCGAAYKISCTDPNFYRDPVIITPHDGENVAERFLDRILHDARELREMLAYKKPMDPLTPREQAAYDSPHAICHICKKVTRSSFFSILSN